MMRVLLSVVLVLTAVPIATASNRANAEGYVFLDGQPAEGLQICVVRGEKKGAYDDAKSNGVLDHTTKYCWRHIWVKQGGLISASSLEDGYWYFYARDTPKRRYRQLNNPEPGVVHIDSAQSISHHILPRDKMDIGTLRAGLRRKSLSKRELVMVVYQKPAQEEPKQVELSGTVTDTEGLPLEKVRVNVTTQTAAAPAPAPPENSSQQQTQQAQAAQTPESAVQAFQTVELAAGATDAKGAFKLTFPYGGYKNGLYFSATLEGFVPFTAVVNPDKPQLTEEGNSIHLISEDDVENTEAPAHDVPLAGAIEATRRSVFRPRLMESLPLGRTRSFDDLVLLAPGVLPPPQGFGEAGPGVSSGVGTAGQFSVNGLRSRENSFTVDGSDNNDEDIGTRRQGFVNLAPQPVESLKELQVVTALGDARFGRNLGGHVNALTRAGDEHFHGSLYGFITDDALNARNFFDQTSGGAPQLRTLMRTVDNTPILLDGRHLTLPDPTGGEDGFERRQGGFDLGGRIPILKNATFYASVEGLRVRAEKESHFAVPTVRQRGLFDSGETGFYRRNPGFEGVPFLEPFYPASVPGDAIFSLYPFPNNPAGPHGANTYTAVLPADASGGRAVMKVEKRLGEPNPDRNFKWRNFFMMSSGDVVSGRYNITQERSTLPVTGGAMYSSLRPWVRTQNATFLINRTLSGNLFDTILFSFGRTRLRFDEVRDPSLSPSTFFPGVPFLLNAPLLLNVTAPRSEGGLNPTLYVSAAGQEGAALLGSLGYPSITHTEQITGPLGQVIIPGFSPLGVDVYSFPQERANNTFQIADTFTYDLDRSLFTFGFDVRKTQINSTQDRNFRPLVVFNGLRNSLPDFSLPLLRPDLSNLRSPSYSGTTLAALGLPTGLFQTLSSEPNSTIGLRFTQVSLFLQDEFRLRRNLRATVGVRYELNTVPDTVNRRLEDAFDPAEFDALVADAVRECGQTPGGAQRCAAAGAALRATFPGDFKPTFGSDRNDFNVRFGAAWGLTDDGRTVLRGGFGVYTGQFNGLVLSQSRNAFPDFLPVNLAEFPALLRASNHDQSVYLFNLSNPLVRRIDPSLNNFILPGTLNTLPNVNPVSFLLNSLAGFAESSIGGVLRQPVIGLNLVLPSGPLLTPYALQYGATLERQFGGDFLLSAAYVGTRGVRLLRVTTPKRGWNRNGFQEQDDPAAIVFKIGGLGDGPLLPNAGGVLTDPQDLVIGKAITIAPIFFESSGNSTYNSLQLEVRRRYRRGLEFGTAFTFSHSIDDASDYLDTAGAFALPQNSLRTSERASSNFDVRLRSATHFTADLPYEFQLAGILTAQTGQPFTVNSAFDINRDGNLTDRLNTTAGLRSNGDRRVVLSLAPGTDPNSLLAPDGQDGAVGRNTFRATGVFNLDLAVIKHFTFPNDHRVSVRGEFFNLFNRAHFAIPERILEAPAFGSSTKTIIPARVVQFSLKYTF